MPSLIFEQGHNLLEFVSLLPPSFVPPFPTYHAMRVLAVFVALAVGASALGVTLTSRETNAQRFARGLPPLPPIRRSSLVDGNPRLCWVSSHETEVFPD